MSVKLKIGVSKYIAELNKGLNSVEKGKIKISTFNDYEQCEYDFK